MKTVKTPFESLRLDFVAYLAKADFSPDTVEVYGYHIREYLKFIASKGIEDVRRAGTEVAKDYHSHLVRKYPNGFWSVSVKLRAAYNLFEFLVKSGQIIVNPHKNIKAPKLKRRIPRNILTRDEVKKILDQPDLTTAFGIADRAILELFYCTGIRLKEMAGLTIHDVDFKNELLFIRQGKWNKDRTVPLGPHAVKFMDAYLKNVRPRCVRIQKVPSDALWLGNAGKPLSRQIIARRVLTYGRDAGVEGKSLSPHAWRHTFATSLIRGGAPVRHVQEFLGHAATRSTTVYTTVTGADIMAAHAAAYPEKPQGSMPTVTRRTKRYRRMP